MSALRSPSSSSGPASPSSTSSHDHFFRGSPASGAAPSPMLLRSPNNRGRLQKNTLHRELAFDSLQSGILLRLAAREGGRFLIALLSGKKEIYLSVKPSDAKPVLQEVASTRVLPRLVALKYAELTIKSRKNSREKLFLKAMDYGQPGKEIEDLIPVVHGFLQQLVLIVDEANEKAFPTALKEFAEFLLFSVFIIKVEDYKAYLEAKGLSRDGKKDQLRCRAVHSFLSDVFDTAYTDQVAEGWFHMVLEIYVFFQKPLMPEGAMLMVPLLQSGPFDASSEIMPSQGFFDRVCGADDKVDADDLEDAFEEAGTGEDNVEGSAEAAEGPPAQLQLELGRKVEQLKQEVERLSKSLEQVCDAAAEWGKHMLKPAPLYSLCIALDKADRHRDSQHHRNNARTHLEPILSKPVVDGMAAKLQDHAQGGATVESEEVAPQRAPRRNAANAEATLKKKKLQRVLNQQGLYGNPLNCYLNSRNEPHDPTSGTPRFKSKTGTLFKLEDFKIVKVLGTGSYGLVLLGHLKHDSSSMVALKLEKMADKEDFSDNFVRPMTSWFDVNGHENVAMLLGYSHVDQINGVQLFEKLPKILMLQIMEMGGVDLAKCMEEKRKQMPPDAFYLLLAKIYIKILSALVSFQKENMVHCDLKPENILLNFVAPDVVEVKVVGLGYRDKATKGLGTPMFMSPEIARGNNLNQITILSDVFSVGASLWFSVCEKVPTRTTQRSLNQQEMNDQKKTAKKQSIRAFELLEIAEKFMLNENPSDRAQPEKCKEKLEAKTKIWED